MNPSTNPLAAYRATLDLEVGQSDTREVYVHQVRKDGQQLKVLATFEDSIQRNDAGKMTNAFKLTSNLDTTIKTFANGQQKSGLVMSQERMASVGLELPTVEGAAGRIKLASPSLQTMRTKMSDKGLYSDLIAPVGAVVDDEWE